jgi:hypothetical protein
MMSSLFLTIPSLFLAWVFLYPEQALAVVVEIKRRLRLRIIRKAGSKGAQQLAASLHQWASQEGLDPEVVDEVLDEHLPGAAYRLGVKQANAQLGEPTLFERIL